LDDRIRFYVGNAEELSDFVPVDAYDLVYSFGAIHHTPHPDQVIRQIRRYMRPGGRLKVMVYHRRSWKALNILLVHGHGRFWALDEILATYAEAQTGCPIAYAYLPRQIPMLLDGFRVREIRIDHIFPYQVLDYVQYRYRKAWCFRVMPTPVFQWLERHLGWHLCVTAEMC
jgi:SAM-dependent methyltransferase